MLWNNIIGFIFTRSIRISTSIYLPSEKYWDRNQSAMEINILFNPFKNNLNKLAALYAGCICKHLQPFDHVLYVLIILNHILFLFYDLWKFIYKFSYKIGYVTRSLYMGSRKNVRRIFKGRRTNFMLFQIVDRSCG